MADEMVPMNEDLATQLKSQGVTVTTMTRYLYSFSQGGNEITDLTADGIGDMGQRLGISIVAIRVVETDDSDMITVEAKSERILPDGTIVHRYGVAVEKKSNRFHWQQAYTKAQRNAIKAQLPMTYLKEAIRLKYGEGALYADDIEADGAGALSTEVSQLKGRLDKATETFRTMRTETEQKDARIAELEASLNEAPASATESEVTAEVADVEVSETDATIDSDDAMF